jgi:maltooligosyltrehalose trehalohydrolase
MDFFPAVGAIYQHNNSCLFTVWSPLTAKVELIIEIGESATVHPMSKDEYGYWRCTLENISIGTTYLFQLENNHRLPDPASRSQEHGVHGPSSVVDQKYPWNDSGWHGLPLQTMILYEIHVATFTPEGTFEGVISRLPYLKALGINAIEIMPVSQFPGDRNWGYDGVFPFAVQQSYGGPTGLKKLVNEAHHQGIAVILDVVYNHQGPEGNYLACYGPYFTKKYHTGWGDAINFDDAWCDGVRHFYWQNAIMWLEEFHVDGLRLDAVHAIWDNSAVHFIEELSKKVKALEAKTGNRKVLIAEFDLNNPRYINPFSKGGYALDGQWTDEFHHALHAIVTEETDGYYEDFGAVSDLIKSFKDSYVYTGQFSKHRKRHFGILPENNPYHQFVVFAQNHDQVGNRMFGDRLTAKLSFDRLKLVAAALLLSPHIPMLFMGEEYGETNPFQYFISHTDEKLVEMVRQGRKKEFAHFNWRGQVPDPQDPMTFASCKLSWATADHPNKILLEYYSHLIAFRKERLAMRGFERNQVNVYNIPGKNLVAFERMFESDRLLILLNFDHRQTSFLYPAISLTKLFDSAAAIWNPDGKASESSVTDIGTINVSPHSAVIFAI